MNKEFEYTGEWWLPSNRDKRIAGRLRFNQNEGAVLELDGCFTDNQYIGELFNPVIVNGVSSTGSNITLHRCFGKSLHRYGCGYPGVSTSELYAHEVFVGVHFEEQEDIKFKHLFVCYSHLDEWLHISGFDFKYSEEELVLKYKSPDPIRVLVSGELELFIRFKYSSTSALTKFEIRQEADISIVPVGEMHSEEYLKIMHRIQDFLSFAIMEPVYPLSIEGVTGRDENDMPKRVSVFYGIPNIVKSTTETDLLMPLFTFDKISNDFERLLRSWFEKAEQLEPVSQLYFGSVYNPHMYLEQRFLCIIQALESYHRRSAGNCELPEGKHEERIKEILDAVPKEHKKWLTGKLEYSNEPSLRRRLQELLRAHDKTMSEFLGGRKNFINKVCVTRNYLIHYDPTLKDKTAKKEELNDITLRLRVLVEACLLKELGFGSGDIHNLLSSRYRRIRI
ncbi:MAG: hypothetical protein SU899_04340 [Chloroflexota bacterium]|nr:hypothetical protein [Chloroflexota bacterium]